MESCDLVVQTWIFKVVLIFCCVNLCTSCRKDNDCPRTHVCQRDQDSGICVEISGHPKENGVIVGILSAMIVLILCLVALLAYICHRNIWRRSSWGSQTSLTFGEDDLERHTLRIVRRASSQPPNSIVTIPRYFLQRQLSVASTYSGPPPYFSIFNVLTEDTQRVRRTDIDSSEVLEIDAIQVCELPPPSYETVEEEVLDPPRYEDAINMNK